MHDMGLEPERYIVGNELNSINPITGQPEFFFKKLFKKIKNVVKKVAPVVLPIALSFALGPIYGAAAGSGISTLLQGGSLKDAAKSALISGAIGGVTAGITGPSDNFLTNVKSAATNPLDYAANMRANMFGSGSTAAKGETAQAIDTSKPFPTETARVAQAPAAELPTDNPIFDRMIKQRAVEPKSVFEKYVSDPFKEFIYNPAENVVGPEGVTGEGTLESIFSPSRASISEGAQAVAKGQAEVAKQNQILSALGKPNLTDEAAKALLEKTAMAAKTTAPSLIKQYAPLALAGTGSAVGIAALGYSDEDGDGVDDSTGLTLNDYKLQYPDRFFGPGFYGDNPYYQDPGFLTAQAVTAARGGEIKGPGTPTSDSIPAMLSDGEFVMNAKAVRGAGGGNRKAGAKRMYDMMRKFERMA